MLTEHRDFITDPYSKSAPLQVDSGRYGQERIKRDYFIGNIFDSKRRRKAPGKLTSGQAFEKLNEFLSPTSLNFFFKRTKLKYS